MTGVKMWLVMLGSEEVNIPYTYVLLSQFEGANLTIFLLVNIQSDT